MPGRFVATRAWLATTGCPKVPLKVKVAGAMLVFCVPEPVNKNLFTVPPGIEPRSMVFSIELPISIDVSSPGVLYPFSNRSATAPATWGLAIEVPLKMRVELEFVEKAEVISVPGARISTQLPLLLYEAKKSVLSVAPTVIAFGDDDGDESQALADSLPAATTTDMPLLMMF